MKRNAEKPNGLRDLWKKTKLRQQLLGTISKPEMSKGRKGDLLSRPQPRDGLGQWQSNRVQRNKATNIDTMNSGPLVAWATQSSRHILRLVRAARAEGPRRKGDACSLD